MEVLYKTIKQYYFPVLITVIGELSILFFLPKLSIFLIPHARAVSLNTWQLWNVWDVPHYISIAENGYRTSGDPSNFIVFLPMLPLLIMIVKFISQTSFLISGYIVSFFTTIFIAAMLYKLTLIDYSRKTAILAVLMLFIFPTAFFLYIPYSESLLILLAITSIYFVRKKNYILSFFCAGLAGATKIIGLALIPAIFLEILIFNKDSFKQIEFINKLSFFIFGLVVSISGFLVYLIINHILWGDFLFFTVIQRQHWYETFSLSGEGLINAYHSIFWRVGLDKIMLGYVQIAAFILGLVLSLYVLFKVRVSYGVFMLTDLFLSSSMSFWISMPRHTLTLFPMYIALALLSKNVLVKYLWILFSAILLIIFALIFIQYGPIF